MIIGIRDKNTRYIYLVDIMSVYFSTQPSAALAGWITVYTCHEGKCTADASGDKRD